MHFPVSKVSDSECGRGSNHLSCNHCEEKEKRRSVHLRSVSLEPISHSKEPLWTILTAGCFFKRHKCVDWHKRYCCNLDPQEWKKCISRGKKIRSSEKLIRLSRFAWFSQITRFCKLPSLTINWTVKFLFPRIEMKSSQSFSVYFFLPYSYISRFSIWAKGRIYFPCVSHPFTLNSGSRLKFRVAIFFREVLFFRAAKGRKEKGKKHKGKEERKREKMKGFAFYSPCSNTGLTGIRCCEMCVREWWCLFYIAFEEDAYQMLARILMSESGILFASPIWVFEIGCNFSLRLRYQLVWHFFL